MAVITNNTLNREIGELKTKMASTDERLKSMEDKIDKLMDAVAMSRGSIKALVTIGSIVAACATAIGSLVTWILGRH